MEIKEEEKQPAGSLRRHDARSYLFMVMDLSPKLPNNFTDS